MSHLIQNENHFSRKNATIRHFNRRKFRRHFHTRRPLLTLTGLGCWTWHKLSADREENNKKPEKILDNGEKNRWQCVHKEMRWAGENGSVFFPWTTVLFPFSFLFFPNQFLPFLNSIATLTLHQFLIRLIPNLLPPTPLPPPPQKKNKKN